MYKDSLTKTLPTNFNKVRILHDRITDMIQVPFNQIEKHTSDYNNFAQRTLQQWPYTDVGMMTYLDDEYSQIVFQRMSTIFQNIKCLYESDGPQEIIQSKFYSNQKIVNALLIVSFQFKYLVRIIEQNEPNPAGMWAVWLCVTGEWKLVVLDDTIPCTLKGNTITPALCVMKGEYWNMIIEKAIVKQLGGKFASLNRLYNETTESFIQMLTGFPINKIQSTLVDNIVQYLEMKFIIFCEVDINKSLQYQIPQKCEEAAYLIVKIQNNMITLRSADRSLNLPSGTKQNINEFEIALKDFVNIFSQVSIVKAQQNYSYSWLSLESNYQRCVEGKDIIECDSSITFDVKEDTHLYISICQVELNQIVPEVRSNFIQQYALVRIIIVKVGSDNDYQFICGDLSYQRHTTIDIFLQSGSYIVITQIYFPSIIQSILKQDPKFHDLQKKATIQFYAAHLPININYWQGNYANLEMKIISSIALALQNGDNTRNYEAQGEPNITVTTLMTLGILMFYYRNKGNSILNEQIKFQERINLLKYDGEMLQDTDTFNVQTYPSNEFLVIYKYDPIEGMNPLAEFSYSCDIKAQLQTLGTESKESLLNHNDSEKHTSEQNDICQIGQLEQKYTSTDLMKFMQEYGKITKRVWNDKPIEVYMYVYQHYKGVILVLQNQSSHPYEENMSFELRNLEIKCRVQALNDVVQFIVEPYSHLIVYLDVVVPQSQFGYKFLSHYKYYPV